MLFITTPQNLANAIRAAFVTDDHFSVSTASLRLLGHSSPSCLSYLIVQSISLADSSSSTQSLNLGLTMPSSNLMAVNTIYALNVSIQHGPLGMGLPTWMSKRTSTLRCPKPNCWFPFVPKSASTAVFPVPVYGNFTLSVLQAKIWWLPSFSPPHRAPPSIFSSTFKTYPEFTTYKCYLQPTPNWITEIAF